jgi:hypothetical protein
MAAGQVRSVDPGKRKPDPEARAIEHAKAERQKVAEFEKRNGRYIGDYDLAMIEFQAARSWLCGFREANDGR